MNTEERKDLILEVLEEKKAEDIELIPLARKSSLADYFIVCTGLSRPMVNALADDVQEKLSERDIEPKRVTGKAEGRWVLLDYGTVVVHIFHPEERAHYKLEQLWEEREPSEYIDPPQD